MADKMRGISQISETYMDIIEKRFAIYKKAWYNENMSNQKRGY